jgi:hypothetical protein
MFALMGLLMQATYLSAGTLNLLVPDTSKDGVLEMYDNVLYMSADSPGEVGYVGNPSGNGHPDVYNAVYKFQVDSALTGKVVTSATLHLYCNYVAINSTLNPDGVEVFLQHYISENATSLEMGDYTKPTTILESKVISTTGWTDWDVTDEVKADVDAGYGYTSFSLFPGIEPWTKHCARFAELSYVPQWQAYITVEYATASANQLAEWPGDFSSTQGIDNWYYLYTINTDYNASETELQIPWNATSSTYEGSDGLSVRSGQVCPGNVYAPGFKYSPVLRWVSDVNGDIHLTGTFQKVVGTEDDPAHIDGILGIVRVNGIEKWNVSISGSDTESHPFDIVVPGVKVGDDVDFVVYSVYYNYMDTTNVNVTITTAPAAPIFSPSGPYIAGQTPVTINSPMLGATIYYTDDGSIPTTDSKSYTNEIMVKHGTTLKAFLVVDGERSAVTSQTFSTISHGRQVLVNRGLQIQSLVNPIYPPAGPDVNLWLSAKFTTFMPWHTSTDNNPSLLAQLTAAGVQWSRESFNSNYLASWEFPYQDNFVAMQYKDELFQTPEVLADEKAWFTTWNMLYPNALAYTNFSAGNEVTMLRNYMQTTNPDMLMFDYYPNFSFPDSAGSIKDRNTWYFEMQKFRTLALGGNDGTGRWPIPYAQWLNTYRTTPTGPLPSESYVRLQQFASWAFGYTFLEAFMYNKSGFDEVSPVLFDSITDSTTPVFDYMAETNRQSRNLGPALVRLLSTDLRMILGQHGSGIVNSTPEGITTNITGADPYITGITATNLGSKNNGLPGDVILGCFKVLEESMDGDDFSNQRYFMVTNGLIDAVGSATETRQNIRISFNFGSSGITKLERLNRNTGKIEMVSLVSEGGSLYHLDLVLDGGTGDLFKYKTGAPFVGGAAVERIPGDANEDGMVDVGDLGILAANYGGSNKDWSHGDFNNDKLVDVGDLGILAAHYGQGTGSSSDFSADYTNVFGMKIADEEAMTDTDVNSSICSSLGLPLIAGLALMGLMLVKMEE